MFQWLVESGADIEAGDGIAGNTALMIAAEAGATTCVQLLLQAGAMANRKNECGENAIGTASNEKTIRLLTKAGEDIGDISTEMKRTLTGLERGDAINVSKAEYLSGRGPRSGKSNPEVMTIPFWHEMVRAGVTAYQAKSQFGDTDNMEPVWCFSRFGTSFTELPDDIRGELEVEPTDNQGQVAQLAQERCREFLRSGTSFAFNATNTMRQTRGRWLNLFANYNARIEIVYVEPPFQLLLRRNNARSQPVPETVIHNLAEKCEPPTWIECHQLTMSD